MGSGQSEFNSPRVTTGRLPFARGEASGPFFWRRGMLGMLASEKRCPQGRADPRRIIGVYPRPSNAFCAGIQI